MAKTNLERELCEMLAKIIRAQRRATTASALDGLADEAEKLVLKALRA